MTSNSRCCDVSGRGVDLARAMEARDGVYHDADEGEVEVGDPGQALGVAESRVCVMTGQDVPEETDALALDVSVLLGQSVVEVGQAETH